MNHIYALSNIKSQHFSPYRSQTYYAHWMLICIIDFPEEERSMGVSNDDFYLTMIYTYIWWMMIHYSYLTKKNLERSGQVQRPAYLSLFAPIFTWKSLYERIMTKKTLYGQNSYFIILDNKTWWWCWWWCNRVFWKGCCIAAPTCSMWHNKHVFFMFIFSSWEFFLADFVHTNLLNQVKACVAFCFFFLKKINAT